MSFNQNKSLPEYAELFSRNLGLVSEAEQNRLADARVAIPGLGGVGGAHALTLARMGVGNFHLSDPDIFEPANFNRQSGATLGAIGRKKTEVIKEIILTINPHANVKTFEAFSSENKDEFLKDVQIVMDGLDFFVVPVRRLLYKACEEKGIYLVTSGPIGMTMTLHVFGPGGMSSEDYFDFGSCKSEEDLLVAFAVGVTPGMLQLGQIDPSRVNLSKRKVPSLATAIHLSTGLACTEALHILLGRRPPFLSPRYFQFDPSKLRLKKGRLWLGGKSPIQKLKRWYLKKLFAQNKTS